MDRFIHNTGSSVDSDLLAPEEFQEVFGATDPDIIDSVLREDVDLTYVDNYDSQESKLYCPNADSTQVAQASATGPLPAREDYPGPYSFSVLLENGFASKSKWTYSQLLNKLYIEWDKVIPIQFKWIPNETDLVVRALPVYTDAQDMQTPVTRCIIHSNVNDVSNQCFDEVKHVIRSDNLGAIYDYNNESQRTSVLVPLGELQPGTGSVTVTYKFMCKTSCSTGMMRRPITVLFTLERSTGEVIGRQKLNVKICCCPKRDRIKDEESTVIKQEDELNKSPISPISDIQPYMPKRMKLDLQSREFCSYNIRVSDHAMFNRISQSIHGCVLSILRSTPRSHPSYTELTDIVKMVEDKQRILLQSAQRTPSSPS